ncbi:hypothetical protein BJ964_006518 [Actinoplanes lobatus]|uniref:Uncharacterized protein n=1 Tax=Actinoplanes lobatus TaxID=113568 RepID=A0A7W7MJ77_9ACTN|nr:hypothetical protein [Actinoplanes lobatus]
MGAQHRGRARRVTQTTPLPTPVGALADRNHADDLEAATTKSECRSTASCREGADATTEQVLKGADRPGRPALPGGG